MDKIRRFVNLHIPYTNCTLRCHYCYVTVHQKFDAKPIDFPYSPAIVRQGLSKKRLGGVCIINICASGETLLAPIVVEYIHELLKEGHYVAVVSNCTISKAIDTIVSFEPELCSHLFVKASYHYLELKKRDILGAFFSNVKKLRDAGCSFTVEITPNDELIPEADDAVKLCIDELGAMPHFTVARNENDDTLPILTNLSKEEYISTWGKYNSDLFNFKLNFFGTKIEKSRYARDLCIFSGSDKT